MRALVLLVLMGFGAAQGEEVNQNLQVKGFERLLESHFLDLEANYGPRVKMQVALFYCGYKQAGSQLAISSEEFNDSLERVSLASKEYYLAYTRECNKTDSCGLELELINIGARRALNAYSVGWATSFDGPDLVKGSPICNHALVAGTEMIERLIK
jgi:hypothetical protein